MMLFLARIRRKVDRLGMRLAVVLAVALLPLMIVSIVRSQSVINEALARSQSALVGETLRAVRQEVIIIEGAKAVAQLLSRSILILLENPDICNRVMQATIADSAFSFVGYYDVTGNVPCSSAPEPHFIGLSPLLLGQLADPRPSVLVADDAPVSETSIIYASYPVYSDAGELLGFTSVSVPLSRLRQINLMESDATFLTLNSVGAILTAGLVRTNRLETGRAVS